MFLLKKLRDMRDLGLITFQDEDTPKGRKPVGRITETDLWSNIRVAFGGMSMAEAAMLSRHSKGMAVVPVFGLPAQPDRKSDVFVLMPFKTKLGKVYFSHIKKTVEELGHTIRRADERLSTGRRFMDKVWEDICSAQLVIADCTEKSPNVFYEIGIAHAVGKTVVLITRSKKDIPSDLKDREYIEYADNPKGVDSLTRKLRKILTDHFKA
jgi:hypothetical protein